MGLFSSEIQRFKWRHPIIWRRAKRELDIEGRIYDAVAGVLKSYGIPDKGSEPGEDEPSYTLMVAVMRVLRREKVKL